MTKVVILAGGRGTRLAEETTMRPKPMVEIGGIPILAHIMATYAQFGHREFLIACGYKGEMIRDYFTQWQQGDLHAADPSDHAVPMNREWSVGCIDTGMDTMTGGRILRLRDHLTETFMVTYGDGVCNADLQALLKFHKSHGRLATVTAVRPPARWGALILDNHSVQAFSEKCRDNEHWINGGYFVFEPEVFDYLQDDTTVLEQGPLDRMAADGQLMAYMHHDYWQPMDTIFERDRLKKAWASGEAPWATGAHRFGKWNIDVYDNFANSNRKVA